MTNDNHYGEDSRFRGIKGVRWVMYLKSMNSVNDACFGISDIKINRMCDESAAHCPSTPRTPETLT